MIHPLKGVALKVGGECEIKYQVPIFSYGYVCSRCMLLCWVAKVFFIIGGGLIFSS